MVKFAPGDTVYIDWSTSFHRHTQRETPKLTPAKIAKVGRRWVTLEYARGDYRFDPLDGLHRPGGPFSLDGGGYSSPGEVWPSVEDRDAWLARVATWERIRRVVGATGGATLAPDHVPTATLAIIADVLDNPAAFDPARILQGGDQSSQSGTATK